jgi:SAM-dependent methyltransferase
MDFEIAIEGPVELLRALRRELGAEDPEMEVAGEPFMEGGPVGRLVLEETEAGVNPRLQRVSRTADRVERRMGTKGALSFQVRNRAYAEPSIGGERPREPFRPVGSVIVQPWYPGLQSGVGKGTVVLDPAHAFGNGRHPTTRMCLAFLERMDPKALEGLRVLDFGCGTALLALAAVQMGAAEALGVERDPASARAAERNVGLNRLEDRIRVQAGSWEVVQGTFDLVLANLVPAALLRTGDRIFRHCAPGGTALISGFGRDRTGEMEAFFTATGLSPVERIHLDVWGSLVMTRPVKDPEERGSGEGDGP